MYWNKMVHQAIPKIKLYKKRKDHSSDDINFAYNIKLKFKKMKIKFKISNDLFRDHKRSLKVNNNSFLVSFANYSIWGIYYP